MRKDFLIIPLVLLFLSGCTKDGDTIYVEVDAPTLSLEQMNSSMITMQASGSDVTFAWPGMTDELTMNIAVKKDGIIIAEENFNNKVTSFVQHDIETNKKYEYLFRLTDGTKYSDGILKTYIRQGASSLRNVSVEQREGNGAYEASIKWTPLSDAAEIEITADNGTDKQTASVDGNAASYVIKNLKEGQQWNFRLVAKNSEGESLPAYTSLKVGKTAVAFLSYYPTEEELLANGDDDEAAAWLWFHAEYPNSKFLYFGDIKKADDLSDYRELFYIRDIDNGNENDVWEQPAVVKDATPFIIEWYKNGGNILLWQHACTYIGDLGRIDKSMLMNNDRRITTGAGNWNDWKWYMAVHANLAGRFFIDYSQHPIYNGVPVNSDKTITLKGSCWTEDHNCCFFNIPSALTGMHNQSADTYKKLTDYYGIYPLGTWDNEQMQFVSMLNVWEARQGNTDYKGTILCMGNGGLEFSYKNADGTPDLSPYPMNNPYHGNVLKIAKNAIEYLKTR
jgi:hypothetical protein